MLRAPVLHDDVGGRIGDDDRIGKRVDDRRQQIALLIETLGRLPISLHVLRAREHRSREQSGAGQGVRVDVHARALEQDHGKGRVPDAAAAFRSGELWQLAAGRRNRRAQTLLRHDRRRSALLRLRKGEN